MRIRGWLSLLVFSSASCASDAPAPIEVSAPAEAELSVHACCGPQIGRECDPEDCGNSLCMNGIVFTPKCTAIGCVTDQHACPNGFGCSPHGPICLNQCIDDDDCVSGFYCHDGGCSTKLELGTSCAGDNECASAHCIESVCCQEICDPCFSCVAIHQSNPTKEGACRPVRAGEDPQDQCQPDGTSCGFTGSCDGQGSCAKAQSSQACGETTCSNGVINGALCDGDGGCLLDAGAPCAPSEKCDPVGTACSDACQTDPDCPTGFFCLAASESGEKHCSKKQVGNSCAAKDECASGYCENSRCCPGPCPCDEKGACPTECKGNGNCQAPSRCDLATGRCLVPNLVDAAPLEGCSVSGRSKGRNSVLVWLAMALVLFRLRRPR
jgi:hypothetical protein